MSRASPVPVAILGAGLTGLSAAERLERERVAYRIYERADHTGGLVTTTEESGYRFDRTGHLLHLASATLREEVLDWLDGDCTTVQRRSVVWSNGVYTRYPFQANTFGLPPQVAYECLHGFVQAHFAEKTQPVDNFEQFCMTHFGPGISRHFMLPYNSRLWGVAPSEITSAWCQRFVPLPRLEDVLAGAVGMSGAELGYNAQFLYPRRGIGELSRALTRRVRHIELAKAPKQLRAAQRELVFADEVVRYEQLISSIPLPALLGLFDALPPEVERARVRLRATSLHYLDVALDVPVQTDFQWSYVPEERYPFYRVGCYSHFSPEMAPPGKAGLYVELTDRRTPDLGRLLPQVLAGLVEMGCIGAEAEVAFVRQRTIEPAYVIYDHAHAEAVATAQEFLTSLGIVSTGRYGGWNYSSMEDALVFGRDAAHAALGRT